MSDIPVISLSAAEDSQSNIEVAGKEIIEALESIGFFYVKDHGIPEEMISRIFCKSDMFFALPTEVKKKYLKPKDSNHGWMEPQRESLNPSRPPDLKEAFNMTPKSRPQVWPTEVEGFQQNYEEFWKTCSHLTLKILECMAIGLGLPSNQLAECHQLFGEEGNASTLRTMYYPGIDNVSSVKERQVRCGEHTDFGSITLLFQDEVGGLEVKSISDEYLPVPHIPGCIVVNIGGLMERWAVDRLVAAEHRVLIPTDPFLAQKPRRSIAFFAQPDDDVVITSLDGSEKYEPITALDYLNMKFGETYLDLKKSDND